MVSYVPVNIIGALQLDKVSLALHAEEVGQHNQKSSGILVYHRLCGQ